MMCKRLEFKNLLKRFEVDTPVNTGEENFKRIEDFRSGPPGLWNPDLNMVTGKLQ